MMAFTMDLFFRHMNPLWYVWLAVLGIAGWAWGFFKWFFLLDWWQPTTLIGKLLKWPVVTYINIPFSIPATAAYLAIMAGADPSVVPGITPEVAGMVIDFVNQ